MVVVVSGLLCLHCPRDWKGLLLLLVLVEVSCGFSVALSSRSSKRSPFACSIRLEAQQTEDDPGDSVNSALSSKISNRCPDFPSFAFDAGEGSGGDITKVRVRRNGSSDASSADTSSWVYKVATELPIEPGLFLDVANSARRTRLLKARSYASATAFAAANITCPPSLSDLDRDPPVKSETFWISTPARFLSLAGSIWAFPYIIQSLDTFVTLPPEQLNEIASTFGPGISIIYGTFVSLTLSVLYNRQQYIQDDISQETSLLTVITRNLLTLFANDKDLAVKAAQTVADQIRTLVKGSRGSELTLLMYSDPYSRMLELIAVKECQLMSQRNGELGGQGVSVSCACCMHLLVIARYAVRLFLLTR